MLFVDTHSHFYTDDFKGDRKEILKKAKDLGVERILLPNIDVESLIPMFGLAKEDQCFFTMLGLHPTSVTDNFEKDLKEIESHFDNPKICAVGEVGIDLYWDKTFLEQQVVAFEKQIRWSLERNLPLCIHTRKAFDEVISSLRKFSVKEYSGVFHCFSGDLRQAQMIIEMGFKIGIGGVVTFKNAKLSEIVKEISLEDIVLETDAPYLAPTPYRGQRNDSSYIPIIAQKIAQIKDVSQEEVANVTTNTAIRVFNL